MPRGRARGYDGQREAILVRAAELFALQGYDSTSMNEVAQACGVSKPTLYHYVRDKYQLLVEIAEGHVDRLRAVVDEVAAQPMADEQRLRLLIERFVEEYADAQSDHRVLTEDVRFLEPDDRARVLGAQRQVVDAFAQVIARLRPELAPAGLHKPLTMLLFGMINWMFTWLQPDGRFSHEDMAPVVADLFLHGLPGVRVPAAMRDASAATDPRPDPTIPTGDRP